MSNYAGADWMQRQLDASHKMRPGKCPEIKMSPFGMAVADLLGEWQRGIYHLDHKSLYKADWTDKRYIEFTMWCHFISTYDDDGLTRLVFLAHEAAIRVALQPATHNYMKIAFWNRFHETDERFNWHPNLDEAVEFFKSTSCVSST